MARALWKGYISFGLVSIACSLTSMEEPEKDISFTMLDGRDLSRIRYQRVNERTGKEVEWKDIVKGHEIAENEFVVITPDDFKRAAPKATKTIDIVGFVELATIKPWYYVRPYAVQPQGGGEKGYRLLCEALAASKQAAIAKVVLHTRQHLAALIPHGGVLVLNTLRFDQELRDPAQFEPDEKGAAASKREIEMAQMLIGQMAMSWTPGEYEDKYRDQLRKWIAKRAKQGGRALPETDEQDDAPETYDIMEMLKRSIEGQKSKDRPATTTKKTGRRRAG